MPFDTIALLIDTYWMFLAAAIAIGIIVGWIAADHPEKDDI